MKKFFFFLFLISNGVFAQQDLFVTAFNEFDNSISNFSILQKDGIVLVTDNSGTKKYYVDYDEGSYSQDGQNYLMIFTPSSKNNSNESAVFVVRFDNKKKNILAVEMQKSNSNLRTRFLTEKGKTAL